MKFFEIALTSVAKRYIRESAMLVALTSRDWDIAQDNQSGFSLAKAKRSNYLDFWVIYEQFYH